MCERQLICNLFHDLYVYLFNEFAPCVMFCTTFKIGLILDCKLQLRRFLKPYFINGCHLL